MSKNEKIMSVVLIVISIFVIYLYLKDTKIVTQVVKEIRDGFSLPSVVADTIDIGAPNEYDLPVLSSKSSSNGLNTGCNMCLSIEHKNKPAGTPGVISGGYFQGTASAINWGSLAGNPPTIFPKY